LCRLPLRVVSHESCARRSLHLGHVDLRRLIGGEDNLEEARAAYERALQLDTSKLTKEFQAILVNNLGVVYQKQGKLKEAVQQYTRALELNPNYQDAKDNLARAKERL